MGKAAYYDKLIDEANHLFKKEIEENSFKILTSNSAKHIESITYKGIDIHIVEGLFGYEDELFLTFEFEIKKQSGDYKTILIDVRVHDSFEPEEFYNFREHGTYEVKFSEKDGFEQLVGLVDSSFEYEELIEILVNDLNFFRFVNEGLLDGELLEQIMLKRKIIDIQKELDRFVALIPGVVEIKYHRANRCFLKFENGISLSSEINPLKREINYYQQNN